MPSKSVWVRRGVRREKLKSGVESEEASSPPRFESSGGQSGSSERCEAWSAAKPAVQNCGSVEKAGEKSPASDRTVRGDRASGRSEQTLRNGRALKRASTLKREKARSFL